MQYLLHNCHPSALKSADVADLSKVKLLAASCVDVSSCLQVLALAIAYQSMTSAHLMRPPIDEVEPNILDECLQYSRCGRPEIYNSSKAVDISYIAESG